MSTVTFLSVTNLKFVSSSGPFSLGMQMLHEIFSCYGSLGKIKTHHFPKSLNSSNGTVYIDNNPILLGNNIWPELHFWFFPFTLTVCLWWDDKSYIILMFPSSSFQYQSSPMTRPLSPFIYNSQETSPPSLCHCSITTQIFQSTLLILSPLP